MSKNLKRRIADLTVLQTNITTTLESLKVQKAKTRRELRLLNLVCALRNLQTKEDVKGLVLFDLDLLQDVKMEFGDMSPGYKFCSQGLAWGCTEMYSKNGDEYDEILEGRNCDFPEKEGEHGATLGLNLILGPTQFCKSASVQGKINSRFVTKVATRAGTQGWFRDEDHGLDIFLKMNIDIVGFAHENVWAELAQELCALEKQELPEF